MSYILLGPNYLPKANVFKQGIQLLLIHILSKLLDIICPLPFNLIPIGVMCLYFFISFLENYKINPGSTQDNFVYAIRILAVIAIFIGLPIFNEATIKMGVMGLAIVTYGGSFITQLAISVLNWELLSYLFFGGMTTFVSLISFILADRLCKSLSIQIFNLDWLIPQTISFVLAVIFAFATNKKWVFNSQGNYKKELLLFVGCRLGSSFVLEYGGLYLVTTIMGIPSIYSKISMSIAVVLANYVLSKYIVFKKQGV